MADGTSVDFESIWTIDRTEIVMEGVIGRGAFGEVHRGSYLGTQVAIKKINYDPKDKELAKFLTREVALMKALRHPQVVVFMGVARGEQPNETLIITEYLSRGSLSGVLRDEKIRLSWARRARIVSDIVCAMAYLHSRQIIFRDMKADNVLVDDSWRCKLTDFGLARTSAPPAAAGGKNKAHQMTMCGSDEFMSPEVILGMAYDSSTDVFSFGIVLFEIISRKSIPEVLPRTPMDSFGLNEERAREIVPRDCPEELSSLAFLCCTYEPPKRPSFATLVPGVAEMVRKLEDAEKLKSAQRKEKERSDKKSSKKSSGSSGSSPSSGSAPARMGSSPAAALAAAPVASPERSLTSPALTSSDGGTEQERLKRVLARQQEREARMKEKEAEKQSSSPTGVKTAGKI